MTAKKPAKLTDTLDVRIYGGHVVRVPVIKRVGDIVVHHGFFFDRETNTPEFGGAYVVAYKTGNHIQQGIGKRKHAMRLAELLNGEWKPLLEGTMNGDVPSIRELERRLKEREYQPEAERLPPDEDGWVQNPAALNPTEYVSEETLREYLQGMQMEIAERRFRIPAIQAAREKIAIWRATPQEEGMLDKTARSVNGLRFDLEVSLRSTPTRFRHAWGLFVGILRHYKLSPADRRNAEAASRFFHRTNVPKVPYGKGGDYFTRAEAVFDRFEKEQRAIAEYAEVAARILAAGGWAGAGEEGKLKAGPFLLVNSGGFKPEVMEIVAQAVREASKLMEAKGLGMACYGEAHVVGRLGGANQVAHYMPDTDTFFLRVIKRREMEYVRNVIHELAHRLISRFLPPEGRKLMKAIYFRETTRAKFAKYGTMEEVGEDAPRVGETISEGGHEYVVTEVGESRVWMHKQGGDATHKLWMSKEAFARTKQRLRGTVPKVGFVTKYAGKDEDENFCEMVSYYCDGTLPKEQADLLEPVLATIIGRAPSENPVRRKSDDKRFPDDISITDYFLAGSPKALEALSGSEFADATCVRCGSKIKHVFMTQYGPMGGDCIATLTGDDSTRKEIRKVIDALKMSKLSVDHYGGRIQSITIQQSQPVWRKELTILSEAFFFDSGQRKIRVVAVTKTSAAVVAAVVGWAEENDFPVKMEGEVPGATKENPASDRKLELYEGWNARPVDRYEDLVVVKRGHYYFLAHRLGLQLGKPWTNRAYTADKAKFYLKDPKGQELLARALIAWGEGRKDDPSLRDAEEDESYNFWTWGRRITKAEKAIKGRS